MAMTVLKNLNLHLTDAEKLDYAKNMVDLAKENDANIGKKMSHYALVRYACQNKKSKFLIWKA
jgi:hypothetical protein